MVARALYAQAGGAESQLSSINADPQIVRLSDSYLWSNRFIFIDNICCSFLITFKFL